MLNEYLDFYKDNFFTVIPIKSRAKAPEISGWQYRRQEDFNPAEFGDETNVGVVLGDASGGLVDIDLDSRHFSSLLPASDLDARASLNRTTSTAARIREGLFVCRAVTARPCLNAAGMVARR